MTAKAELHVTGTGDLIPGCIVNLNSADAWFFLDNLQPSVVASAFLSRVRVGGAAAVLDANVRVVQYFLGAVVIPHAPGFAPMEVFDGKNFTGPSKLLTQYTAYNDTTLGALKMAVSSFKLKRGYTATVAQQENGTGISKNYVAADGDIEVSLLPAALDNAIRFVRIFPWRWVSKKGIAGNIEGNLNVKWLYNWNLDRTSPLDWEYVPIRQVRYWPDMNQDWKYRGATHVLGYNEPDQTGQANMTVADAINSWPDLLGTGLRVGAPAVSDGGVSSWLYKFITAADDAKLRVDFVPVHYYRSYSDPANPTGAANQLYNFLKGIYDTVKRPLWVTEWNNGANWTSDPDPTFAQQQATIAAMTDMLDNAPFVERYALYNWVEDVRRLVWDDGSLTAAGVTYRDNASPIAYVQELADAASSPAAHYIFEGNVRDSSGNGNDGTQVGTPVFAAGKFSQSITLNGVSDYVQLPPQLGDTTDLTFGAWVYWGGGANWQRIFDFGSGTNQYFFLSPKADGNTLRFAIKNGGAEQQINWTSALPVGAWTHVAVTITGTTGKLFVNGALVNTNPAMDINPVDGATKFNFLGKSQWPDPLFNGRLDEFMIFNRALSAPEVAALTTARAPAFTLDPMTKPAAVIGQEYEQTLAGSATDPDAGSTFTFTKVSGPKWLTVAANGRLSGVPTVVDAGVSRFIVRVTDGTGLADDAVLNIDTPEPSDLIVHYEFDGTTADSSGGTAGTTTGTISYDAGLFDKALRLNGTDASVRVPANLASALGDATFAARVRWNGGGAWQRIFDFGSGTGQYFFLSPSNGGAVQFGILNSAGTGQVLVGPSALPVGEWTHVAVTLTGSTGTLYVNGAAVASGPITLHPSAIAQTANYLGKSQYPADPLFNGVIDDFRIYSRGLAAGEIAALASPPAATLVPDPSFAAWAAGLTFPGGQSGPTDDPDGDGVPNFYEYLLGSNPLTAGPSLLPQLQVRTGA